MKIVNNSALLNLIGQKFHVRDVREFTEFEEETRNIFKMTRVDGVRWVNSILFQGHAEPEIALSQSALDHENVDFVDASFLVFSPVAGSAHSLPADCFNTDGTLKFVSAIASRHAA